MHYYILGTGLTAKSYAQFLTTKNIKFSFLDTRKSIDNLDILKNSYPDANINLSVKLQDLDKYKSPILISPGVALKKIKLKNLTILGELDLLQKFIDTNKFFIGITGTNGKSTTANIINEILKSSYDTVLCGNIGYPLLTALIENPNAKIFIVEISSAQLEQNQEFPWDIAAITNINPDHLDYHLTFKAYKNAKLKVLSKAKNIILTNNNYKFININNYPNATFTKINIANTIKDNLNHIMSKGNHIMFKDQKETIKTSLIGTHNMDNILIALGCANILNINLKKSITKINDIKALPHRMQYFINDHGVIYIDDSKSTTISSTIAALKTLPKNITIFHIVGGILKEDNLLDLAKYWDQSQHIIYCIGQDSQKFFQLAKKFNITAKLLTHMSEAIYEITKIYKANDIILLSPCCASLDQFNNFEARGFYFQNLANKIKPTNFETNFDKNI